MSAVTIFDIPGADEHSTTHTADTQKIRENLAGGERVPDFLFGNSEHMGILRCQDDAMIQLGIEQNDLVIFDRRLEPSDRAIVIARINNV